MPIKIHLFHLFHTLKESLLYGARSNEFKAIEKFLIYLFSTQWKVITGVALQGHQVHIHLVNINPTEFLYVWTSYDE